MLGGQFKTAGKAPRKKEMAEATKSMEEKEGEDVSLQQGKRWMLRRTEPIHWGRVGDPINPSIFDYYAMSKGFSEMALYDSGLKYWVSIRQTSQHPNNEAGVEEPIIFHQPPNNVLEWSTSIPQKQPYNLS